MIKMYKFLIIFACTLQVPFLYTGQESSDFAPDFAQGFFGHSKATTDTADLDPDFMVQCNAKVEDEDAYNSKFNQIIIAHENVVNNSKSTIQDIKIYVSWYPHLDEGFRILQIQNPLFTSFHDFLTNSENIDDDQISNFGKIIQDAENLIATHIKDAFFSRELTFATKCIYENQNDDYFNEIFRELSTQTEEEIKTPFLNDFIFQIQSIHFVMKYRHNFMKNILKSWFDEQFTILHKEYYNLICKESSPDDSDDELEESHVKNIISTNITHDNPCMLKFIIEIDPNYLQFQDKYRHGLLHYAAHKNAIRCAQLLIEQKININLKNGHGATPLFCAIDKNNIELTQILISAHADVNFVCQSDTPLRRAVKKNNIEITRLLINAEANQKLKAHQTFRPLDCAAIAEYEDIVDILIHAGPTNPPAYHDLKYAELAASTTVKKAEIRRIRKQLYPEYETSCCTIS